MTLFKKCSCCEEVKPLNLFYRRKNGHYSQCKVCRNIKTKLYQQSDKYKEKHKKYCKERYQKNRKITPTVILIEERVKLSKDGKKRCIKCGEIRLLDTEFKYKPNRKKYDSRCRICRNEERRLDRKNNPEKYKKKYQNSNRVKSAKVRAAIKKNLQEQKKRRKEEKTEARILKRKLKTLKKQILLSEARIERHKIYCLNLLTQRKKCKLCQQIKFFSEFNKGSGRFGLQGYCSLCSRKNSKKKYLEERNKYREKGKTYYKKNKKLILAKSKTKEYREYRRNYEQAYNKKRLKEDPIYKLKRRIRELIRGSFKRRSLKKTGRTFQILGCDINQFRRHLEDQFKDGMTWDNYGFYGWHIDHIIPLAQANTTEEVIKLNHYTNFQPLWWYENLSKSDSIEGQETTRVFNKSKEP